jgi:phage tail protein X
MKAIIAIMSKQYITHITLAGERWDLLAWRYYGLPALYSPIIMANPRIAIESVFEAGLTVNVPIVAKPVTPSLDLPPWKRNG